MDKIKVSVAMATYNGEKYLIEQLDSLRNQTREIDEIMIFDDGSKDQTPSMVRDYIERYHLQDKWFFHVNEVNLGYADNFHKAMTSCTGDYILFCDQDDIWMEDKVEAMVNMMELHPEILTLASDYEPYYVTEDAPVIEKSVVDKMVNDNSLEFLPLNYTNIFINSEGCTMCIRKTFIDKIEKYWHSKWPHDEYVWKMAEVEDGLYMYHKSTLKRRLHSNNVSHQKMHDFNKRLQFLKDLAESHKGMLLYAKDMKLPEDKLRVIERNIKSTEMRVRLMEEKKYGLVFPLAFRYADCYHSKKAILMELLIAIKG